MMTPIAKTRRGFTLTELLVVITIISMLAAASLGGLRAVQQRTNASRTQRTIQKVHFLLMEKLEEYQTKRVKLDNMSGYSMRQVVVARTIATHDLMRMEMPDRLSDIIAEPINPWTIIDNIAGGSTTPFYIPATAAPTSGPAYRYARRIARANGLSDLDELENLTDAQCANLSAELLYMIIMDMPGACDQFAGYEIRDTNGNGMKEFVDAWGEPIRFLRWAPGLDVGTNSEIQMNDPVSDLSPFDPYGFYRAYNNLDGFMLFPLIYSSGPDKLHGVNVKGCEEGDDAYCFSGNPYRHADNRENIMGAYNIELGSANGTADNYPDNITNHILDFGTGR